MASRLIRPGAPRSALVLATVLCVATGVAGCMTPSGLRSPIPAPTVTPPPDAAIVATRTQVDAELRAANFALIDVTSPYRPPETPALAAAPRGVYRIVLPDDPTHGLVVIWDLGAPAEAAAAARAYATFLGSGPVRVEFPPDTRFVLRQLGSTVVLNTWSAANAPDASGSRAADALETIGQGFAVG